MLAGDTCLDYADLWQRVRALAGTLSAAGAGPESVVAVALPRSIDFVVALLAVIEAGAAYLPVDVTYPQERVRLMLTDAQPAVVVCHDDFAVAFDQPENGRLAPTDVTPYVEPRGLLRSDHPAYLIFTSGSTGRPKAVIGTQRALTNRLRWGRHELRDANSKVRLSKSPLSFIDGTTEILDCLVAGDALVVADDTTAGDPLALVELVDRQNVAVVTVVPSLLATLVDSSPPGTLESVRTWVSSGEPLTTGLAVAVAARWPLARLVNLYGCSEIAGDSLVDFVGHADEQVSIGRPITHTDAHVLGEFLRPVAEGEIGELYLAGDGLARGYFRRPGLTAQHFVANPFGPTGSRLYRTGDHVRRDASGAFHFVGRVDDQVKIRGTRVELREVEATARVLSGIAEVAVVTYSDAAGLQCLAAHVVPLPGEMLDPIRVRQELAGLLPAPMVPTVILVSSALPKTLSGKVDRKSLPRPDLRPARDDADPGESILCRLVAEVLGLPEAGPQDNFLALGGHSLSAVRLVGRVRSVLDAELSLATVFETATLAELADQVERARSARPRLVSTSRPALVPLAPPQRRMWFVERLNSSDGAYHLPLAVRVSGALDHFALRAALDDISGRHEILRTTFPDVDGVPYQVLVVAAARVYEHEVGEPGLPDALREAASLPFNLATEPPWRVHIFKIDVHEHVVLVVTHHIAADGWSMTVLLRDLESAYGARRAGRAPDWVPLPVQYADYALWQQKMLDEVLRGQLSYWTRALEDMPEEIRVTADLIRRDHRHEADIVRFRVDGPLHGKLVELAQDHRATPFMVLQAGLAALLTNLGAGDDVPIGTPVAGRPVAALDDLMGFFVNTLVLRVDTSGDPTFVELLKRVRTTDLAAYANQDVPFDLVVEMLNPLRSSDRSPLLRVVLAAQAEPLPSITLPGLRTRAELIPTGRAKFDLVVTIREVDGFIDGELEYDTGVFDRVTAEGFVASFMGVLQAVCANPEIRCGELVIEASRGRDVAEDEMTIHGFRVAPAEIEACLRSCPGVEQATVVLSASGELVAHVVPPDGTCLDHVTLRGALATMLPDFLIPTIFNREMLSSDESKSRRATALESLLCGLFAELLGRESVGVDENFFDLGGHSMVAAQVTSRVRRELGVELSIRALFDAPTVSAFAALVSNAPHAHDSAQQPFARAIRRRVDAPGDGSTRR